MSRDLVEPPRAAAEPDHVDHLLDLWRRGDDTAPARLVEAVYADLRALAARRLRLSGDADALHPTELVHEAYLRLVQLDRVQWRDRAHFFGVASQVMRRVLVDAARRRRADKRGGPQASAVPLENLVLAASERPDDVVALDEALTRLAALDARQARVVECRFFAGMDVDETAVALGISPATVKRDWVAARAWLNDALTHPA